MTSIRETAVRPAAWRRSGGLVRCVALTMALPGAALVWAACARAAGRPSGPPASARAVIQNAGSDTMVNVAQAWAEEYAVAEPSVSVEVSGGGSGTGIAALINGTVDIANSSRQMDDEEMKRATEAAGHAPARFIAGYDALAIFVHRDNPLEEIGLDQLAEVYGEHGAIVRWSDLGVRNTACRSDEIILVSRQSNSGTFFYFREALFGKSRDMRLGTLDLHGSKDVVELVGRTPCAIGYSGLGYASEHVKMLRIAKKRGEPSYAPNAENTISKRYPIARPLYMYTRGVPTEPVLKYLAWIHSDAGQRIVEQTGYVPLPPEQRRLPAVVQ